MSRSVNCPTCGKMVIWSAESAWRPFCSERCKLIDLGDWAAERHVIPGNTNETTEEGAPGQAADNAAPSTPRRTH